MASYAEWYVLDTAGCRRARIQQITTKHYLVYDLLHYQTYRFKYLYQANRRAEQIAGLSPVGVSDD